MCPFTCERNRQSHHILFSPMQPVSFPTIRRGCFQLFSSPKGGKKDEGGLQRHAFQSAARHGHMFFFKHGNYEFGHEVDIETFLGKYCDEKKLPLQCRTLYELIHEDQPSFLYADVEYELSKDDSTWQRRFELALLWLAELCKACGHVFVLPLLAIAISTRTKKEGRNLKHSYHFIYHGLVLENAQVRKALCHDLGGLIFDGLAQGDADGPALWRYLDKGEDKRIVDFGVYSRNRAMRLVGSSKPEDLVGVWSTKESRLAQDRKSLQTALWPLTSDRDGKPFNHIHMGGLTPETAAQYVITNVNNVTAAHAQRITVDMLSDFLRPAVGGRDAKRAGSGSGLPRRPPRISRGPETDQEAALRVRLQALVRAAGDERSVVGAVISSVPERHFVLYQLATVGERKCISGAVHSSNNACLAVDVFTGQVRYKCLSARDACKAMGTTAVPYGYVQGLRFQRNRVDGDMVLQAAKREGFGHVYTAEHMRPLADAVAAARGQRCKAVLIRSAMDTRKTVGLATFLADEVARDPTLRVGIFCHRKTLAAAYSKWARSLGFRHYEDRGTADSEDGELAGRNELEPVRDAHGEAKRDRDNADAVFQSPRLIIQYESLNRIITAGNAKRFDYIILDEFEATLTNVSAPTNGVSVVSNANTLQLLLATCKLAVIALCADAGTRGLSLLHSIMGGEDRVWTEVNQHVGLRKEVVLVDGHGLWRQMLLERLINGENIAVCTNTVREGKELAEFLKKSERLTLSDHELQPGDGQDEGRTPTDESAAEVDQANKPRLVNYFFYHGDMDNKRCLRDFADVDSAWKRLQLVIYTSKVSCGISFDVDGHFDCVFAYASRLSTPPRVNCQMICRPRKNKTLQVIMFVDAPVSRRLPADCYQSTLGFERVKKELRSNARLLKRHEREMVWQLNLVDPQLALGVERDADFTWIATQGWMLDVLVHNRMEMDCAAKDYYGMTVDQFLAHGWSVHCYRRELATEDVEAMRKASREATDTVRRADAAAFDAAPIITLEQAKDIKRGLGDRSEPMQWAAKKAFHQACYATPVTAAHYRALHNKADRIHVVESCLRSLAASDLFTTETHLIARCQARPPTGNAPTSQLAALMGQHAQLHSAGVLLPETSKLLSLKRASWDALTGALGLTGPLDTETSVPSETLLDPNVVQAVNRAAQVCAVERKSKPGVKASPWTLVDRIAVQSCGAAFRVDQSTEPPKSHKKKRKRQEDDDQPSDQEERRPPRKKLTFKPIHEGRTALDIARSSLFCAATPLGPLPPSITPQCLRVDADAAPEHGECPLAAAIPASDDNS